MKTCCVTGHRALPGNQWERVEQELQALVRRAVAAGFDTFISGFAEGTDLLFAKIVQECKENSQIRLIAVIPYRNRLQSDDPLFQSLLKSCDDVQITSETYSPGCFHVRNRRMVDHADAVIAVYDGRRSGGSYYTMQYAKTRGKALAVVRI